MDEKQPIKRKFSISEHDAALPIRPSIKNQADMDQTNQDTDAYTGSGVSLNDILNKTKRSGNQDGEELGYAASMMNEIREKNLKRAKKLKIIFLSAVAAVIVIFIVLLIVFPDFAQIFKI